MTGPAKPGKAEGPAAGRMGPGWAGSSSQAGGEDERARAGQDKGPPHLTSLPKEPATISMTKRSPCQFGLAPRGDLPTAFEVGSRAPSPSAGRGLGSPRRFPPAPPAPRSGVQRGQDPRHMGTWQQDPWDGTDRSVPTLRVGTGAGAPAHAVHGTHALCTGTRSTHTRPPCGTVPKRTAHGTVLNAQHLAHARSAHSMPRTHSATLSIQQGLYAHTAYMYHISTAYGTVRTQSL